MAVAFTWNSGNYHFLERGIFMGWIAYYCPWRRLVFLFKFLTPRGLKTYFDSSLNN